MNRKRLEPSPAPPPPATQWPTPSKDAFWSEKPMDTGGRMDAGLNMLLEALLNKFKGPAPRTEDIHLPMQPGEQIDPRIIESLFPSAAPTRKRLP